jgi:predicted alpha-1,2-mannosidase
MIARGVGTAFFLAALASSSPRTPDVLTHVDPFIGTGGHGHTFPGPTLPFGMVQLGPDTRLTGWDGCSGYHYDDDRVFGFSHTHLSGTGVPDYGDVLLLPATGPLRWPTGYGRTDGQGYGSRFRKSTEKASAGFYSVELDDYGIRAELTATRRVGLHRYTFSAAAEAHVLVDLQHRDEVIDSALRVVGDREVEGFRRSRAWARDQHVYFVARFSKAFDALLADGDQARAGRRESSGRNVKAALRFTTSAGERVLVKVGISAVSIDGARRNLEAEAPGWDFDALHEAARREWREALERIEVEGGTPEQRTVFYTALYHALLQPNTFTDVDGAYRGVDGAVHRADGYTQYTVFSLWDTFRAAHPLYTLLEPARTTDFIRTFLSQYEQGGLLPVWELAGNETMTMIGYHAVPVIVDAYVKGIRGFDAEKAFAAMKASAARDQLGLPWFRRLGFIPGERESESVSTTLEYAYDDWCIAVMARALGRTAEEAAFLRRGQGWRHLVDPQTGLMRPRLRGRFKEPFDPREVDFHFTEANSWQYSFFVPHDVSGHMAVLGGPEAYAAKLDALFTAPTQTTGRQQVDITGLLGQYAHGNEPSHHMAYLYSFAGQPWRTQAIVRRLMDTMYTARPDGLVGNEDCGQMSAWLVLSALGFYSVTPGRPEYVIGTPLFPKATLRLPSGRALTITAEGASAERPYVQSATLDGQPFSRAFLRHDEILKGGSLVFRLGPEPNRAWGTGEGERPASSADGAPVLPAPFVAAGSAPFRERTEVSLASSVPGPLIRYTVDGSEPGRAAPAYERPITLTDTTTLRFQAFQDGYPPTPVQDVLFRRLPGSLRLDFRSPWSRQYPAGGPDALIDGERGGDDYRLGEWQGFYGRDLEAMVDLGEERALRRLTVGFLQDQNSWIFMPLSVSFGTSRDGVRFEDAGEVVNDVDAAAERPVRKDFSVPLDGRRARYVRIQGRATITCPTWHKGAPNPSWVFADEILIE